jgi:anti-sigma factor RsiW
LNDPTPSSAEERRIQDYLAGRLDAAAAERFEQRLFEDDALAAEVQSALEIRAATATQAAAARRPGGPPRRVWYALAVAASAAALAIGIVWQQQPPPDVFRGVEQRMGLEIEVEGAALRARWQAVGGAASYELQVLSGDGRVLSSLEADGTAATVDLGASGDGSAAPAFVEVSALDGVGQALQRSERLALPNR